MTRKRVDRWLEGGQPEDLFDIGKVINLALHNHVSIDSFQSFHPVFDLSSDLSFEETPSIALPDLTWLRHWARNARFATPNWLNVTCSILPDSAPSAVDR